MNPEIMRIVLVALGIGMVIFVHEGGHFIAARLCGVRVEVFSLGFGPKVLGFKSGGTQYQLALIPFGGYVRMAGEFPPEDGAPPPSDSLRSKNVPQRFFIYAGGVIMNVVFALVCFPLVYHFGVPAVRPIVGSTQPGMPAWHAGIPAGAEILKVQGREVNDFMGIPAEVAIAGSDPVTFEMRYPGDDFPREVVLQPKKDERNGFFRVGLGPAADPDWIVDVTEGSGAYQAGLRSGDSVQKVHGALPHQNPVEALARLLAEGQPVTMDILREGQPQTIEFAANWETQEDGDPVFGIEPPSNWVRDVRDSEMTRALGVQIDDRIVNAAGMDVWRNSDLLTALAKSEGGALNMEVRRAGALETETVLLRLPDFDPRDAALLYKDLALGQDLESTVILVRPKSGADLAGLKTGDLVLALDDKSMGAWEDIQAGAAAASMSERSMNFRVQRAGHEEPLSLAADATAPVTQNYGLAFKTGTFIFKSQSVGKAITMGAESSMRMLREAVMTLRQMFRQEISPKNLGGVVTISKVSYEASSMGWTKLLFFLCLLSVNLAFLNVLPIPLLDGGHLFFLLIEGIKGSPVSEKIMGYSQLVGLVLILSLMVYVTYQDILRLL